MYSRRLAKSLRLRDSVLSIVAASETPSRTIANNEEDHFFMHILDCIGALSWIRANQKRKRANSNTNMEGSAAALLASKHRVFWQTVREIADREAALEDISAKEYNQSIQKNRSLDCVLECFPDDAKGSDGRMWLPLHWAVTLPAIHLSDIETIFAANPAAIKAHVNETSKMNPCHLAAMVKNPRLEIIRRLQIYYPLFGSSLDGDSNTPLHLAACHSNSVAMVRELAQLCPAALEMTDVLGNYPLHLAAANSNSVEVVRELAQLHPAALEMMNDEGDTPLHWAARHTNSVEVVRELSQLYPAALEMRDVGGETPLHLASYYSNSVELVRELAQLHPAALEMRGEFGDTPLHLAVKFLNSVAVLRELAFLGPAAVVTMNGDGKTPLAMMIFFLDDISKDHEKLRVLLEVAPQAARIACSSDRNRLPLHEILCEWRPPAKPEMVAMLLAAYKEAVNIPDDDGMLPIHYAVKKSVPLRVLKMIAEENMSNLSVIVPSHTSVTHGAVLRRRLDNLQYIHAMMPELLLSVDDWGCTPLHDLINNNDVNQSLEELSSPLSAASDILRFLLRHCPSLASARDSYGQTLYGRLPADDARLAYARRLLLLAGASSLYPGVLQKMNYAARRTALLVFYYSATKPSIFSRIRHAAGDKSLMRTVVSFL